METTTPLFAQFTAAHNISALTLRTSLDEVLYNYTETSGRDGATLRLTSVEESTTTANGHEEPIYVWTFTDAL